MKNYCGFSWIWLKKTDYIQVGDIVAFIGNDRKRYAHRIVKIDNDKFTMKGDNFTESKLYEIEVPRQNIEGKITWHYP